MYHLSMPDRCAAKLSSEPVPPLAGVRLLVADDNAANRALVRAVLTPLGVEVAEAADGEQAVALAAASSFDLILMDVRMPGLDGRAALDRIRAGPAASIAAPVIAFSADELDGPAAAGFDGVAMKPVSPAALAASIVRALGGG